MTPNTQTGAARPRNRWSMAIWGTAAYLLLLPAVAMRFTSEVNWTASDFIAIGAMLAIACGSYEFATRLSSNTSYRAGCGAAIAGAFLLVWINLSVGMIGAAGDPANVMYLGVLAVGLVGAILVRFRPRGMVRTMLAMTGVQMLVAVVAIVAGWGLPYSPPVEVLGVTMVFSGPWLVSAALFWNAARERAAVGRAG